MNNSPRSEKLIVAALFVLVLAVFVFVQQNTRPMEEKQGDTQPPATTRVDEPGVTINREKQIPAGDVR